MSEKEALENIFAVNKFWRKKYKLSWCELCDVAIIRCPSCGNSSCNAGGCSLCNKDFADFLLLKTSILDYLSHEDWEVYQKCLKLKELILDSLGNEEKEINRKKLAGAGELSERDEERFKGFLI